jgi:hypothetical protein
MKGLGAASRESGQSRVPAPPERMIGTSGMCVRQSRFGSARGLYAAQDDRFAAPWRIRTDVTATL